MTIPIQSLIAVQVKLCPKISIFLLSQIPQTQVPGRLGCWPIAFPPYFAGVPEVEAPGALQRGLHRSRTAAPRRSGRWRPSEISGKNILGQCAAILWSTMGADFDASWVHDFGCEVPHIFLTLRIDTCLGGGHF